MPRALKGRMPRCLPDHRATEAKRLREVFLDLTAKYHVADGTMRRVALLAAQSWLSYERITAEIHRLEARQNGRGTVQALRRLRRQQKAEAKQFRFGVADLRHAGGTERPTSHAERIAAVPERGI